MSTAAILLVEDHAGFANALLQMLSHNPNLQIVWVADSGAAALEYLRQSKVDLVLIDYSLPDMSGIKLVQQLQQDDPDLPCVMLSGHLSTQYAQRALEAGARGYIIKDNPLGLLTGLPRILKGEVYVSEELHNLGSSDLLTGFP